MLTCELKGLVFTRVVCRCLECCNVCETLCCVEESFVINNLATWIVHQEIPLTNVLLSRMSSSHKCPRVTSLDWSPVLPRECSFVLALSLKHSAPFQSRVFAYTIPPRMPLVDQRHLERWGAGVEYHFQEFNEPYAPS